MDDRGRMTRAGWTPGQRFKNDVLFRLAITAMRAVSRLPLAWALLCGRAVGLLGWAVARSERKKTILHLSTAFPDRSLKEWRRLSRRCFTSLGRRVAEVCWLDRFELNRYVAIPKQDREKIDAALAKGRGLLWVTAHYGNWELLAAGLAAHGYDVRPIATQSYDSRFTDLIDGWRRRHNVRTLWRGRDDLSREVGRALTEGAVLGLLIDQDTKARGVFVPFFGRVAWTPRGAADLARQSGSPVLIGFITRRPEGGHVIRVERPQLQVSEDAEQDVIENTSIFTKAIESAVRELPEEWSTLR